MTTEKMTVHKALAELKIVDDRIISAINGGIYCVANKHSNEKIKGSLLMNIRVLCKVTTIKQQI